MTVENKTTRKMISFIEEFRKIDQEMQAQMMVVFLMIAGNQSISQKEIVQRTGLTEAAVSRNVQSLSEEGRRGKPGHNLVVVRSDAQDARLKRNYLTPQGIRVYNTLIDTLGG